MIRLTGHMAGKGKFKIFTKFWLEILLEGDNFEDPRVYLNLLILKIWMEGVGWVYLAVVRDRWRALVCMVMKFDHLSNCYILERNLLYGVKEMTLGK